MKATTGLKKREPWLKRSSESADDYALFTLFRDMGATRTLKKMLKDVKGTPKKLTLGRLEGLSERFEWWRRAEAFDDEQERLFHRMILSKRVEAANDHLELSKKLRERALEILDKKSALNKAAITAAGPLAKTAFEIDRLVVGEPTQIQEQRLPAEVVELYERYVKELDNDSLAALIGKLERRAVPARAGAARSPAPSNN